MSEIKVFIAHDGVSFYDPIKNDPTTFKKEEMDEQVDDYWGGLPEKKFVIPFWRAAYLANQSNINQLAIKLTSFRDSEKVDAEWVAFDATIEKSIDHSSSEHVLKELSQGLLRVVNAYNTTENIAYFVFGNDLLESFEKGFDSLSPPPALAPAEDRLIVARIGKVYEESIEKIILFFILGEFKLHLAPPGSAGESAACGARIPPK